MTPRAQSETIGVILLTAVIVVTVSAAGVIVLADAEGEETTRADLSIDIADEGVSVAHNGGESVPLDSLRVVIKHGNDTWRPDVNASGVVNGGADGQLDSGDRWVWRQSLDTNEVTRVQVFDRRTSTLVAEERRYPTGQVELTPTATPTETATPTGTATPTPTPEPDTTPPTVTVETPNGRETLRGGKTYTIEWTASDDDSGVSGVDVAYSTDDGSSWTTVATDRSGGSYEWNLPSTTTQNAIVRVTATDGAGNSASDRSDATFTIDADDPTVDRISPNDSAPTYTQSGQNVTVSWETSDPTTGVDSVAVSIENDTTTVANTTVTAAAGSATLTVPEGTVEGNYSVAVEAVDAVGNTGTDDRSDAVIVDDTSPGLTLEVQDESEESCVFRFFGSCFGSSWNEEYQYQWSSSGDSPYSVDVSVERDGNTLETNTERSGSGSVTRDSRQGATYRFVLSAADRAGNSRTVEIIDDSDGNPNNSYEVENGWMVVEDGGSSPTASLDWSTAADWDDATANGVSHDDTGGADPGTLRLGAGTGGTASDSLLVYYPLDGSGDAEDATGNGRLAANDGATTGVGGISGSDAYEFGGDGDALEDADAEDYLNGLSGVSASMWIQSDTANSDNGVFFTGTPSGSDDRLGLRYDASGFSTGGSNLIKYSVSANGAELNEETVSDTQTTDWQHLVVTWTDGGDLKLYVDGVEIAAPNDPSTGPGPLQDVSTLLVGKGAKGGGSSGWDGKIDEFRIYDRALSADEAASLHDAASAGELRTAPKTFDGNVDPSTLSLANVSASVPTGTDATVYVQSDPDGDGTFEEESSGVSLTTGAGNYTVDTSGMSSSDTYRLRIVLESDDVTATPEVGGVALRSE